MSLFGQYNVPKTSIFSFRQSPGSIFNPLTVSVEDLMFLFQIIENLEEALQEFFYTQEMFNLDVTVGFQDLNLRLNFLRLYARRLYSSLEYPLLPNGFYDCKLLLKLYTEHPILRLYDFCENEPQCSYCVGT
jgi:hypothetical protein